MNEEDQIVIDSILAAKLLDALNLRGFSVAQMSLQFQPQELLKLDLTLFITRKQVAEMLFVIKADPRNDR